MRIKVSTNFPTEPIIRQTPGGRGVWKDCEFFINNDIDDCDFWFVLDGLDSPDRATVRSGVSVLFTMEPPDRKTYRADFLSQFSLVVTSHLGLEHPNTRIEFQGLPWHIGLDRGPRGAHGEDGFNCVLDYDMLSAMVPLIKTKPISTICSIEKALPGQKLRSEFVNNLREHLGNQIDVFGRGVRPIADKLQALASYKYHIVLENSLVRDYWTEKLADCFLAYCFPIYWGCPNIDAYFPEGSYLQIDITRFTKSLEAISALVSSGLTKRQCSAMIEARQFVLNRYNTFEVICKTCSSLECRGTRKIHLRPEKDYSVSRPSRIAQIKTRIGKVRNRLRRPDLRSEAESC